MPGETPKKEPTPAEAMFFFTIVKHMKNKADIDWAAVAQDQGFKNSEVAKVRYGQVRRKLGISFDSASKRGGISAAASKPLTPTKITKPKPAVRKGPKPRVQVKEEPADYGYPDYEQKAQQQQSIAVAPSSPQSMIKKEEVEAKVPIDGVMSNTDPF